MKYNNMAKFDSFLPLSTAEMTVTINIVAFLMLGPNKLVS